MLVTSLRFAAPLFLATATLLSACGGGSSGGSNNKPATVDVVKSGSGTGTVTGNGISCGSSCSTSSTIGASITLVATPDSGQAFDNWGGDAASCGASATCSFTISGTRAIATASFSVIPTTAVSVTLAGNSMGTVTAPGINCTSAADADCSESYSQGGMVTLTATPANSNNIFSGWSGGAAGCGSSNSCTLMLTGNSIAAVATFQPVARNLTINKTGSGTVTSSPAGISCGSTCAASFQQGSTIKLSAVPADGFTFQGWGGACSGTATCAVTLTADTSVSATFVSSNVTLTVNKLGNGTVTSSPAGIDCGATCSASYARNTSVTLTAVAASTDVFQGWSGGGCSGTGTCTPTIGDGVTVTASFASGGGKAPGELYGLTNSNRIVSFDRGAPGSFNTAAAITSLMSGDKGVAIDTRPADGKIYLLAIAGTTGRLYTVDLQSGVATLKSTLAADSTDTSSPYSGLSGTRFGIDFNPVTDRLRIVSDAGQNLRVNADNGAVITDGTLNQASGTPAAVDGAYTFNYPTTSGTTLFVVDAGSDTLNKQSPPENGTQTVIGSLGVDLVSSAGFEIVGTNIDAFVAGVVAGGAAQGALFSVDLRNGAATKLGDLAGNEPVISLTGKIVSSPAATPGDLALLSASGKLITVNRAAAGTVLTNVAITGVPGAETLLDLDYRTSDRTLYLLTRTSGSASTGKLYQVDATTGDASLISTVSQGGSLAGNVTMDFEPVSATAPSTEKVRLVSDGGLNELVIVATGAVTADTALNAGTTPVIGGLAYSNAFLQSTSTTAYAVDTNSARLFKLAASGGTLTAVGNLGLSSSASANIGFDVNGANNEGLLVNVENGVAKLYSVNLSTGAATNPVNLPGGEAIRAAALRPAGEPEIFGVTSAGRFIRFLTGTAGNNGGYSSSALGLPSSVTALGMDFRPKSGELIVLGSDAKLYSIDPANGALITPAAGANPNPIVLAAGSASACGTTANSTFMPSDLKTISNTNAYTVSFNAAVDRLRVSGGGSSNINLRIDPDSGTTCTDMAVGRPKFAITGASYNSSNVLYGLDTASDRLFTIDTSTNTQTGTPGRLTQVGALGVDLATVSALEIIGTTEIYAAGKDSSGAVSLYALSANTGKATLRGAVALAGCTPSSGTAIPAGTDIRGMTYSAALGNLQVVTDQGCLVEIDRNSPQTAVSSRPLTGIGSGEKVIGMDYLTTQTATTLYIVTQASTAGQSSSTGRLYTVATNGAATAVTSVSTSVPPSTVSTFALPSTATATAFGVNFNQQAGTLRITADDPNGRSGSNLDVNPMTLAVTTQAALNQTVPNVSAGSYTRKFVGAVAPVLNVLDSANSSLMTQGNPSPDDGVLLDTRPAGAAFSSQGAFGYLGGEDGYKIAVLLVSGGSNSTLYRLDNTAGTTAATSSGVAIGSTATNTTTPRVILNAVAVRLQK